jgi:hypothetical protein
VIAGPDGVEPTVEQPLRVRHIGTVVAVGPEAVRGGRAEFPGLQPEPGAALGDVRSAVGGLARPGGGGVHRGAAGEVTGDACHHLQTSGPVERVVLKRLWPASRVACWPRLIFDAKVWPMGADTITAIGTSLAAVVAALVAVFGLIDSRRSRKAAKASHLVAEQAAKNAQRLANAGEQLFRSSSRPILIGAAIPDEPFHYSTEGTDARNWWGKNTMAGYIRFPIRNVGVGPAMIRSVTFTSTANLEFHGYSTIATLAPGESGLLAYLSKQTNIDEVGLMRSLVRNEIITAEISYTDVGARQRYLTRFALSPRTATSDFLVGSTEIYECDEGGHALGEPLATSKLPLTG